VPKIVVNGQPGQLYFNYRFLSEVDDGWMDEWMNLSSKMLSHVFAVCVCVYLVPFLIYSASNNGMTLKSGII